MSNLEYMNQEDGFLGVKEESQEIIDNAKVVIVPYGMESSSKLNTGTRTGPRAIIRASHQLEIFDEEYNIETYKKIGIRTLCEQRMDYNAANALNDIENIIGNLLDNNKMPLILGGEQTLTSGAIRPFVKKYDDLAILHFDSRANLKDPEIDNNHSSLSSIRKITKHQISKIISCGIRSISKEEKEFIDQNKDIFEVYYAKDRNKWNKKEITNSLKGKKVYLTFDLSGFDSSVMAATGFPEPNGFFWPDAMRIIKQAAKVSDIVGIDIVELAPISFLYSCDILAAKLAYKILGHIFNQ
ncbi:arginase family protein [Rickettsiales bacterium]|nr:arginase family protein [Rickettsiales bacterium]